MGTYTLPRYLLNKILKEKTLIYAKYLYLAATFEDWKPCEHILRSPTNVVIKISRRVKFLFLSSSETGEKNIYTFIIFTNRKGVQ